MNPKEWTIMIYMAGDNNLAVDMAYAMEQIKGVAGEGAESRNVLVYYDGNSPQIPTLYCDFSEPEAPLQNQYVPSSMVEDKLYPVARKWNENAADPKSVKNFVNWCVNTRGRRANRYALIFSGHSLGFLDKGLFKDETSGKTMKIEDLFFLVQRLILPQPSLEELAAGLEGEELARETTPLIGQHLDILGFDSCVMGMLEVGYQFQDLTNTMIVSEGSIPSAGWSYAKILSNLCCSQQGAQAIAANFVKDFIRSQDKFIVGGVTVDIAAWNMEERGFDALADAFDGLAQVLIDCFDDKASLIYKQMERIILKVHWQCQSYMYDQNVDLGDFCHLLQRECQSVAAELSGIEGLELLSFVQEGCQTILTELEKTVLLSGFSGGGYQYSNGVAVFFPWSWEGYLVSRKNYESLWFTKDRKNNNFAAKWKGWADFLKKYLSDVTLRKFEPLTINDVPEKKYRYFSGLAFDGQHDAKAFVQVSDAKVAGQEGSRVAGQEGSRVAGQEGSRVAGQEGSRVAGQEGSRVAGQEGSRVAGQEGSRVAGQEGSRVAGQEGSRLAGGGLNAFFESLQLRKNIESYWNISGFSKKPSEDE